MNQSFYKKSSLLILTNITTGILGFLFSIILSREIGPVGMGLYSLVSPISNLLLSVLSGGLLLATSRVVSEYFTKRQLNNLHKTIKTTVIFNFIVSSILIFIVYLFSYSISVHIIKEPRILTAFRFILISIIFMTVSNTYKGYFYGVTNVFVPAFIDVIEKLIRIVVLLILFKLIATRTVETLITISYFVFFIGEINSYILLYIYYCLDKKTHGETSETVDDGIQLLYNIFSISLPLMITELVSSSLYTISSIMLPRRLALTGISYEEALSLIGKFASMSAQIVFFPMLILFSISALLIPDLTSSLTKQDTYNVQRRIAQVIKIALGLGIVVGVICFIYGDTLGQLIYKRDDLGKYISFLSFCAPLIYVSQSTRSILSGLGKQKFILKTTLVIATLQTILLYILVAIPQINIYGFGITIIVTTSAALYININKIYHVVKYQI